MTHPPTPLPPRICRLPGLAGAADGPRTGLRLPSQAAGLEGTAQLKPAKRKDVNANLNLYLSRILNDSRTGTPPDAMWRAFAMSNSNVKLPKNFRIQASSTCQSRTNLPANCGGGM